MNRAAAAGEAGGRGSRAAPVSTYREGRFERGIDWLAEEVPVALVFNGISYAVMLATPLDLEAFALGFALTEGLLATPAELYDVETVVRPNGIELRLDVAAACEFRLKSRRRALAGRTGCGLCGAESLEQVIRPCPMADGRLHIHPAAVSRALSSLQAGQILQHLNGSLHAAAWCGVDGMAQIVREDVGRHNALDKLVGALAGSALPLPPGFIAVTSRASVEMVQKCLMAGADGLLAVSAPTALAVEQAYRHGLALAGFARNGRFVSYTFPERFGMTIPAPELLRPDAPAPALAGSPLPAAWNEPAYGAEPT